MKSIIIAVSLATALVLTGFGPARAEQENHLAQAREHANAAVTQGQTGDMKSLAQHAQAALEHVRMANQEKPLPDLDRAIKSLEETIKQSQAGQAEKANEHAKEAIEYLDAAKAALGG